ncbi:MAG TPA: hypothetical protein VK447_10050, partial [Myxococcaceae bacterium]|nr:hypothetical protein [Myxococcaceae bacterium]
MFPGPGELANWDLHARLEGVLTRALQRGDATAPAAPSAQPVPAATRESGSRPDFRSTANAFPPAASPASAFAGLFDTPSAQA